MTSPTQQPISAVLSQGHARVTRIGTRVDFERPEFSRLPGEVSTFDWQVRKCANSPFLRRDGALPRRRGVALETRVYQPEMGAIRLEWRQKSEWRVTECEENVSAVP